MKKISFSSGVCFTFCISSLVATSGTWNVAGGNGDWNVNGNWTPGPTYPQTGSESAAFKNVVAQPVNSVVTLILPTTVDSILFDGPLSYTIQASNPNNMLRVTSVTTMHTSADVPYTIQAPMPIPDNATTTITYRTLSSQEILLDLVL